MFMKQVVQAVVRRQRCRAGKDMLARGIDRRDAMLRAAGKSAGYEEPGGCKIADRLAGATHDGWLRLWPARRPPHAAASPVKRSMRFGNLWRLGNIVRCQTAALLGGEVG